MISHKKTTANGVECWWLMVLTVDVEWFKNVWKQMHKMIIHKMPRPKLGRFQNKC